ncbi:hypothetical protein HanPSC8_Chr09g0391421 [Helianthus annuus]|nr:hypothetical protein HanPSC8_Chr09g0391421 [Helianthus annuus]
MQINLRDRHIKVGKESIWKILGVPFGGIRVVKDTKGGSDADKVVENEKNRYDKVPISFKNIVDKIREDSYDDEEMFKIDFVMLFMATMIASTKNGHAMYTMLELFCLEKDFKDHDWCQFILDTIRVCMSDWVGCNSKSYFRGPLTVLELLYLDSTACPGFVEERTKAPISFWTHEMISLRKDIEIKNGGFGLGDIRELYADNVDYECLSQDEVVIYRKETMKLYLFVLMGCQKRVKQLV